MVGNAVCLGSQLYLNRGDSPEQIATWVAQMAASGLRLMRLFVLWDLTEPRQGRWDWAAYDAAFNAAAEHGIGVVPTLMAQSPPGWMRVTDGSQAMGDVDDAAYWSKALAWAEQVVLRYAEHAALHSWILWNEPTRVISQQHPQAIRNYRAWLRETWDDDIEAYNRRVFKQYASFDQIMDDPGAHTTELAFKAGTQRLDWLWFSVADLNQRLADLAALVRRHDANHPVHSNPHNLGLSVLHGGQSLWRQADVVDFLGCSAHPPWHSLRFGPQRIPQSIACFGDMVRASTPDPERRYWISELQGGPTLYSAELASRVRPDELRRWLWIGLGGGARAVVFWCFNQRIEGYEAGEWGLLGVDGEPSDRLAVVSDIAQQLAKHQTLFDQARPLAARVAVVWDEASEALGHVDGIGMDHTNPRNANAYHDGLCGAWLWASEQGHEVDFINADAVRANGVPDGIDLLLLPNAVCADATLLNHLSAWCASGGQLIADGLCAFKTADGRIADTAAALRNLFGGHLHDPGAGRDEAWQWADGRQEIPWSLRLHLRPSEAGTTLATWLDDGSPAVIARDHAAASDDDSDTGGRALWLGSLSFQAALQNPQTAALAGAQDHIDWPTPGPLRPATPSADALLRQQQLPDGSRLITLICDPTASHCPCQIDQACRLTTLDGTEVATLATDTTWNAPLTDGIGLYLVHSI